MTAGSYEGPITLAVLLAALGIFRKPSGVWLQVGLLVEAEALFLAGMQFGQTIFGSWRLRSSGVSVPNLASTCRRRKIVFANRPWMPWSPVAILTAGVLYLNRIVNRVAPRAGTQNRGFDW